MVQNQSVIKIKNLCNNRLLEHVEALNNARHESGKMDAKSGELENQEANTNAEIWN